MQSARASRDGGDLQVRIHGNIGRIARQGQLAQDDWLLEGRSINDGQAARARGDIGSLLLAVRYRTDQDDVRCCPRKWQIRNDAGGKRDRPERIKALLNLFAIANPITGGAVFVTIGSNYPFRQIRESVMI